MSDSPDLSHFVQHRQLDVYEQGVARRGYAYGVDLRRSRWLASSTVGNTLVRAVDRAWPRLSDRLMQEAFDDGRRTPPTLLRELSQHLRLLRAPLPTVRVLEPAQRGHWPIATALGATRGGSLWLILDVESLLALPGPLRAFYLGAALGHLHCDHAVFFSAHLIAGRREGKLGARSVKALLAPWTRVMTFSADRAGLLCCNELEVAVEAITNPPVVVGVGAGSEHPRVDWLPRCPETSDRVLALEEFARSAVFAKFQAVRARQAELLRQVTQGAGSDPDANDANESIHVPADAWSLARVDARLTDRLGLL